MPWRRHRSSGFAPASCSFSTPMICSSVNRLFLIVDLLRSTQLSAGRNSGEQVTRNIVPLASLTLIEPPVIRLLREAGDLDLYEQITTMRDSYFRDFEHGDKEAPRPVIDFF